MNKNCMLSDALLHFCCSTGLNLSNDCVSLLCYIILSTATKGSNAAPRASVANHPTKMGAKGEFPFHVSKEHPDDSVEVVNYLNQVLNIHEVLQLTYVQR